MAAARSSITQTRMSVPTFAQQSHEMARQMLIAVLLTQMFDMSNGDSEDSMGILNDPSQRVVHSQPRRMSMLAQSATTALTFLETLFAVYIPRLLIFLLVLFLGLTLTRVVPLFVDIILRRFFVPRHYRVATRYVLSIAIFIAALWLALAVIGIDFFAILITFGVFSLVISVGISNVVSNVIAGITIQLDDLAEPGYDVSVNNVRGIVLYPTLTNVVMRRIDDHNDIVYVPNNYFVQYPVRRHIDDSRPVSYGVLAKTLVVGDKGR